MTLAPFGRDFVSLRDALDRLVEDSLVAPRSLFAGFSGPGVPVPADLSETPDAYVLEVSIPGFTPEDIDVSATTDTVTVKGSFKSESKTKDATYLRQERRAGSFERSFTLPIAIEPDKVQAVQASGVLTVTLPKAAQLKAKHIAIKPAPGA